MEDGRPKQVMISFSRGVATISAILLVVGKASTILRRCQKVFKPFHCCHVGEIPLPVSGSNVSHGLVCGEDRRMKVRGGVSFLASGACY